MGVTNYHTNTKSVKSFEETKNPPTLETILANIPKGNVSNLVDITGKEYLPNILVRKNIHDLKIINWRNRVTEILETEKNPEVITKLIYELRKVMQI
jgi:hypothetical protein